MKKLISMLILAACVSAFATPVNITVTGTTPVSIDWYGLPGFTHVPPGDNEVMPGCIQGNAWDLEAVLLEGSQLSLVGSYDFANGCDGYTSGDLFLALNGDTKYDYALRFDFVNSKYNVLDLSSGYSYIHATDISASDPFKVKDGTAPVIGSPLSFTYLTGLPDNAGLGYTSWESPTSHNEITVDLGNFLVLTTGEEITTHFTIGCGNDELNGHGRIPEPGSLSMILVGLLSLAGLAVSRKRK